MQTVDMINKVYESPCGTWEGKVTGCAGNWEVEYRAVDCGPWVVAERFADSEAACRYLEELFSD